MAKVHLVNGTQREVNAKSVSLFTSTQNPFATNTRDVSIREVNATWFYLLPYSLALNTFSLSTPQHGYLDSAS